MPVFPAIIGIVKSEHNDTGGAFLHAAGSLKTDHVLNMARFLRTSAATPRTKNEKQTKVYYKHWFNKYLKINLKYGNPKYVYVGNYSKYQINKIIKLVNLNKKEEDIILKHMWGATIAPPKYKESYIVTMVMIQ